MPVYNFKTIGKVPEAKDFIDIILSKTQRKTPTVVRRGWKISRVRSFYMRKVKFTQENYTEKLVRIMEEFPRLDDIHPFYADLVNVLYSRDHYKLALGQISSARTTIDTLGKDYLRLLKMGDSLYRCKQLKRAAMGRMCTCMKKLQASLSYLEQVRQHLSRLPSIDPNTRTLMITGYPNVGKSSFINQVSRADVDVQPYAFTTKSLFVGHCDYKYSRWQVIDTPGILDHPLEDRNTIEMQAITALAHLQSTVLFFIDISESCGYSIKQQVSLFHNIKPLFQNKPLLIVANKIDLRPWNEVEEADRTLIEQLATDSNTQIIQMSNQTQEGIDTVKSTACNMLLMRRVERKLRSANVDNFANRISVVRPAARDRVTRGITIPTSVKAVKAAAKHGVDKPKRTTLKALEILNGGPGVFNYDLRNHWNLKHNEQKFDAIPEIVNGKNVADFIDPDIELRLAELEAEEEAIEARLEAEGYSDDMESDLDDDERVILKAVRKKKYKSIETSFLKNTSHPILPRKIKPLSLKEAESRLHAVGLDSTAYRRRALSRNKPKRKQSDRDVDMEEGGAGSDMDTEEGGHKKQKRSQSLVQVARSRSASRPGRNTEGMKPKTVKKAEDMRKQAQKKANRNARAGEGDRKVYDFKPKHLYSGKKPGMSTADWR